MCSMHKVTLGSKLHCSKLPIMCAPDFLQNLIDNTKVLILCIAFVYFDCCEVASMILV